MPPDISDDHGPENPFWQFSLHIYGREAVKQACLALQDDAGADINILLFLCWRAGKGETAPSSEALSAMISAIEPVNREVVHPLRHVRRRLDSLPLSGAEAARNCVLKAELAGEHMVQSLLHNRFGEAAIADQAPSPDAARNALARYLALLALPATRQHSAEALAGQLVDAIFAKT